MLVVTSIMCCKKYLVKCDRSNRRNLQVHDADCLYQLDNLLVEMPYQVVCSSMFFKILSIVVLSKVCLVFPHRRGIGKQLLKACEDLVIKMDAKRRVYLHCRIIDQVPFNMYRKAGYNIVETDNILVWLSLQKRKYLMSKELPQASVVEPSTKDFDDNILTR